MSDAIMVSVEKDEELTRDMKEKIEKNLKEYKPLKYCAIRNPSKRGGNSTCRQPETEGMKSISQNVLDLTSNYVFVK